MTADTYSTDGVGVLLMGTGNDNNQWGANANTAVFQVVMDAVTNALTSAVTGGTLDLSGTPPPAASSSARYAGLKFTGILGSNQLVQVPNLNKWWLVCNATSNAFTLKFKTSGGSASTAIPQNSGWQMVRCDGNNVIEVSPFNTVQIQMPDGSATGPAFSFLNETGAGWYRAGTQDYRLSINGVAVLQVTGTGAGTPSVVNVLSPNALQVNGGNVASQNAVFKAADGAVGAPGYAFNSDLTSGLYRIGAGNVGFSILGVKVSEWNATTYIVNLAATVVGKLSLTSTDSMALPKGTTGQRNGAPTAGDTRYNSTFNGMEYWNGTAWIILGQAVTYTKLTSGTALTYTSPAGVVRHRVTFWAPGGGGAGATANNGSAGSANTSFQVNATGTAWTAVKGNGGLAKGAGGAGGTGGVDGSTGTLIDRISGGSGQGGENGGSGSFSCEGGSGGTNPRGGAGGGGSNAGGAAAANSGAGGGGGGDAGGSGAGAGGGAGEWVQFWVTGMTTALYTIGLGGAAGIAGSQPGGAGAAGGALIEEFYS